MLKDAKEIEIISRARQKNVRDPGRSEMHFINIFADFLSEALIKGAMLVDLGPGQYDFGVLARERGASNVVGVDNDPAVLELGTYKKFPVVEGRLQNINVDWFDEPFDGVFCKFAINCFWFWPEEQALLDHIDRVCALRKPEGWAWIAPWNGVPKSADISREQIDRVLALQKEAFIIRGYQALELTRAQTVRYGVSGAVANNILFVRNLPIPK